MTYVFETAGVCWITARDEEPSRSRRNTSSEPTAGGVKETSPLDPPGALDYKFYAKGVGPVLGVEISGGSDREELVSFRRGQQRLR